MKDARKVCHNSEETSLRNALVAYENAGIALTLGGRPLFEKLGFEITADLGDRAVVRKKIRKTTGADI